MVRASCSSANSIRSSRRVSGMRFQSDPGQGGSISQCIQNIVNIQIIPSIECRTWDAQHIEGLSNRQMRTLDRADDLQFLGRRASHCSNSPTPAMLFLSRWFSRVRSATHSFNVKNSERNSFTSGDVYLPSRILSTNCGTASQ